MLRGNSVRRDRQGHQKRHTIGWPVSSDVHKVCPVVGEQIDRPSRIGPTRVRHPKQPTFVTNAELVWRRSAERKPEIASDPVVFDVGLSIDQTSTS